MSDLPPPPPPGPPPPPPPPPGGFGAPPPGYVVYGAHTGPPGSLALAGFWSRVGAALIDGLLLGIPFAILAAMVVDSPDLNVTVSYGYRSDAPAWLNLLSTLVGVTYYAWFEGGPTGQTIGKRALGIRVVDAATGQPPIGYGRGIGRYFARIISAIPCGLGYLWMLWDGRKQTWHDKIVGTLVVKG